MKLRAIAAAAAAAGLATAPAHAATPFKATRMTLTIELTGIHVLDWHVQDPAYPDPARHWVAGHGTQTLGFSTPRPLRFNATAFSGTFPNGATPPPLVLMPQASPKPLKGSVRRRARWRVNDGTGCDREGGCDGSTPAAPAHHVPSCPSRRLGVPAQLDVRGVAGQPDDRMLFALFDHAALDDLWSDCPPDIDDVRRPLALAQLRTMGFAHGIERIARLRRGATLTLKSELTRGARDGVLADTCPKLAGPGQQECAVTDLTLEIHRLR